MSGALVALPSPPANGIYYEIACHMVRQRVVHELEYCIERVANNEKLAATGTPFYRRLIVDQIPKTCSQNSPTKSMTYLGRTSSKVYQ
jgi:hypothetical protein